MELVALEVELLHLFVSYGDAFGIGSLVDLRAHSQSRGGGGGSDETDDRGQAGQRFAAPVHGDVGKQSMLDLVPLAGSGGGNDTR